MTVPAFPPRSLCRSSWYLCRFQFILFIIPFAKKLTVCCRQIIISGKNFSLRTNGAYRTFHTSIDNWFPLVTAFTASPPDIFPRLCIYLIRFQRQVLFWPLRSNLRVCCLQIVKSFQEYVPTAIRAFTATGTGRNKGVPLSAAILTFPPSLTIGKDRNLSWK